MSGALYAAAGIVPGLDLPDAQPLFVAALVGHVLAGMTGTVAGALAALSGKRPGRHPRAGTVYLTALAVVAVTATAMVLLRWHKWHLLVIALVAVGLAILAVAARRRHRPGWMRWHGLAMPGSYVAMLTGFYVDNGSRLPLWDRLPELAYWLLPAAVGLPLAGWALVRNGAVPAPFTRSRQE